ncbi:hypothetical protein HZH68_015811 [Vespula germanica]|uniref:Uncharacterized protein n=1 Tax=Vespula germanica TaxID=30212 RepID=A0A834J5I7_VESGE|nr:hypothetical protein HZH68_015811 [Vespula germanica]
MDRYEEEADDSDNETDPEQLLNEWLGELDSLTVGVREVTGRRHPPFSGLQTNPQHRSERPYLRLPRPRRKKSCGKKVKTNEAAYEEALEKLWHPDETTDERVGYERN